MRPDNPVFVIRRTDNREHVLGIYPALVKLVEDFREMKLADMDRKIILRKLKEFNYCIVDDYTIEKIWLGSYNPTDIPAKSNKPEPTTPDINTGEINLSELTVKELKELAKKFHVDISPKMRKAAIITQLERSQAA